MRRETKWSEVLGGASRSPLLTLKGKVSFDPDEGCIHVERATRLSGLLPQVGVTNRWRFGLVAYKHL